MPNSSSGVPSSSLRSLTHIIYGLHALGLLIGLTSPATIIGTFLFGVPSIIAVILNYIKRDEARGTILESHFTWQIRTFWTCLGWSLIGGALFLTVIGIPLGFVVFGVVTVWIIYRILKGWLALQAGRAVAA